MAMRRETGTQGDLVVGWAELPRSPGHAFYDELQKVLLNAGFDVFVENACKPYYAAKMGAPSRHDFYGENDALVPTIAD
jgi:transposase